MEINLRSPLNNTMKTSKKLMMAISAGSMLMAASCTNPASNSTGWEYNNPDNGGFEKVVYQEQETGPGLVLIEGGTFSMGRIEQDVMYDWNNQPRRVTVSSFYMDETEVRNIDWLEYLFWTRNVYGTDYTEVLKKALPDTLVWRDRLAFNEPYVEYYLRHPAYHEYPVVGVNWLQANDFCAWRTDRVNEFILIREGVLEFDPNNWVNENNFNTDAYLVGQYEGTVKKNKADLNSKGSGERKVRMEDGIILPRYRLPTEAEWEFAAYSLIGNTTDEDVVKRKLYPWNGHYVRNDMDQDIGKMMANFKRGRGDNMGTAGNLNDNADITAPVLSYWPNDYGLYNMAGNVSEWVMDVYRSVSHDDKSDFRAFRGNVFQTKILNEEGAVADKDSLGHIKYRNVEPVTDNLAERRNYKRSDNINFLDGDFSSQVDEENWKSLLATAAAAEEGGGEAPAEGGEAPAAPTGDGEAIAPESNGMYFSKKMAEAGPDITSMINDKAHVFKGGNWHDRAYWMNPGTRRFLDERQSTSWLGFRCAMTRVGSPVGFNSK
jgi:gliding motility-associated lipoprotein GldJ